MLDVGFDGDMVAFIEAGAPLGASGRSPDARLLAPLVPRSFRDFLAFEGHLTNAYRNLGREVPAEWYEVPVYYRSMGDDGHRPGHRAARGRPTAGSSTTSWSSPR